VTEAKHITVFVTGGGGPGYPLIYKGLRSSNGYQVRIISGDLNPYAANLYVEKWVDVPYRLPSNQSPEFLDSVLRIIEKEKVDVLISAVDEELPFFWDVCKEIERLGCRFVLPPKQALEDSFDKIVTHEKVGASVPVPKTYTFCPDLDLRRIFEEFNNKVVVKMSRTRGNRHNYMAEDLEELEFYVRKLSKTGESFVVQEFISGREFNVSLMFDHDGRCLYSICREKMDPPDKRPNTSAGLVRRDLELEKMAVDAANCLGLSPGTSNVEFLRDDETGKPFLIEVNGGRHAAQDMNLVGSGVNIAEMLIDLAFGRNLQPIPEDKVKDGVFCLKFMDEVIVDYDDVTKRIQA
jgi:carbamoylphosphate synthase large subunit